MSSSGDDRNLPDDVAVEILKRLPVESLLRCRCVCRSWRSAIDDPRFVALHLSHSALDASNWHLACVDVFDPVQSLCSLVSGESLAGPSMSQIEIPFAAPPNRYGFVGSCNGLICATELSAKGCGRSMILWNLFTRKHKAVRLSNPVTKFPYIHTAHVALGFGFDARSNDHKIVRILYGPNDISPLVEVYSLSTDSWGSLECEVPAFCAYSPSVYLNGYLHWFVVKNVVLRSGGYGSIVLFDVASEVFDEMALSEQFSHIVSVSSVVVLSALNDLLAVCVVRGEAVGHPEPHSVCSVWVMREYGVPESWTELYSFEACGRVTGFDGFTWNGELLMKLECGNQVSWNPITGQFAILPLSMECDLVTIVESLVSL